MFKVNDKVLLTLIYFICCSSVSTVNFEQVNAAWVVEFKPQLGVSNYKLGLVFRRQYCICELPFGSLVVPKESA